MTSAGTDWIHATAGQIEARLSSSRLALKCWLVMSAAVEGFIGDECLLRASALTYKIILAIVPMLALAFAVLKGLGGVQDLRPLIDRYLALGSPELGDQLMGYVSRVNAAALGSVGAATVLLMAVSMMSTIEEAFNRIFKVPQSRPYIRKFSDYLSVLFTVPILIVAGLGLTAALSVHIAGVAPVAGIAPYLFVWAGFFFLYVFFPYTRVSYRAALIGSLVTAVLFQFAQWGYVHFQVGVARYHAIYGALASVPVLLVWIYVASAIVLFGAELTAAAQRDLPRARSNPLDPGFRAAAVLQVLVRLGDFSLGGGEPLTRPRLSSELGVDEGSLGTLIGELEARGLIIEVSADRGARASGLFLARAPESINLNDALATGDRIEAGARLDTRVGALLSTLTRARRSALGALTLRDLIGAVETDTRSEVSGSESGRKQQER